MVFYIATDGEVVLRGGNHATDFAGIIYDTAYLGKIIASIGNNTYKSASRQHIHAYIHSILFSFVDSKGRKPVSAVLCYDTGSDLGIWWIFGIQIQKLSVIVKLILFKFVCCELCCELFYLGLELFILSLDIFLMCVFL